MFITINSMSTNNKYDIVIIGSGISGMSLAHYCARQNLKTLVLEKNDTLGGSFTTKNSENFWLELGAHTLYNTYGNLIDIINECGFNNEIIKRQKVPYRVFKENKMLKVMSQFSILELIISIPGIFFSKKENQTIESYYSSLVGKRNYKKFFQYMFNAVPSQPTNHFPANILFKKRPKRKEVPRSFTFKNGLTSLINQIGSQKNIEIGIGKNVITINRSDNRFDIKTDKGETYQATSIALATPVNIASDLLMGFLPEASGLLKKIEWVETDSAGITIAKSNIKMEEVAGIIGVNECFYSAVSRDVVNSPEYRGFTFHFIPGKLNQADQITFICNVLKIDTEDIIDRFFIKNIVPSFKLGQDLIAQNLNNLLKNENILLTGNYLTGMAIEDCVTRSREEFNRLLKLSNN